MHKLLIILNIFFLVMGGNTPGIENSTPAINQEEISTIEEIDLEEKPNELGRVMVLMFHSIGDEDKAWEISREAFKRDLEYLHSNGYYLVSLSDFVKGEMDVPAGKTPVIFTFDDGAQNNFNLIEKNGELIIDPDSAVGIMEEFKKNNPGFNSTATFYIFGTNPFRQSEHIEYKLNFLVDNGYDIGNHTYGHANLNKLNTKEEITYEIAKEVEFINEYLAEYQVDTFALPYGLRPKHDELKEFIVKGNYENIKYENIAILDVGSHPSYSWADTRFDFTAIPRIRVSRTDENQESEEWYEYFEENEDKRYISDGVKDILTIPSDMEEYLDKNKIGNKKIHIYD